MIFLTVGSLDPFDRLVETVDAWAGQTTPRPEIFGQIAKANYLPRHFPYVDFLTQESYRQKFEQADLVISHAGTGSILTAIELGKRIIVLPKLASLGEQRNEHQLATARHFADRQCVSTALAEVDLTRLLNEISAQKQDDESTAVKLTASPDLIQFVRDFVSQD